MAIPVKTVPVNLVGGATIYLMNNQIVEIKGEDGACELTIDDNGSGLITYESDDNITTAITGLLALAESFITVTTPSGTRYLNAYFIKGLLPIEDGLTSCFVKYQFGGGTYSKLIEVSEPIATVEGYISAL